MVGRNLLVQLLLLAFIFVDRSYCHEGHHHEDVTRRGDQSNEWSNAHRLSLKVNQGVDLKWISKDDEYVTMEMSSYTKGYVSVGFCKTWKGTMEGCDIVVGWVNNQNGTAHLYDYFARGNTLPEIDLSQDYELLDGSQDLGVTTIKFRRRWDTGDEFYDANLKNHHVRVMWAWHPEDPFSPDSYFKHAGNSRGHMLQDISFKTPGHYHDHLHSSGHATQIFYQSNFMSLMFVYFLYFTVFK